MSQIPTELRYSAEHQWVRLQEDGTAQIGITDTAQNALGDIVFIELPAVGATFAAGEQAALVESVKSASDVYCPIAGEVVAVNGVLDGSPETVNESPYDAGWFFVIRPAQVQDIETLLTAEQYRALNS
ncbi:Glycine cleavage system H protein [Kingella denitrificans]|uniref:Glycine cleavage system H protein n=1 Tax=Kingella denitrificans ATCC 33394 TaxID=888741 RepID=F0EW11_9NEIS|nr:glycine cleavage system protein GcvH [Kingella denitrificans]EGC18519.1 glycine cleavage system H protein [Kingella denitrificans ATCC 33394]QQB42862.1 glycine cleavage system protein GcvH [Kingella denitrificans]RKW29071.1 MAG: glycine cleavage system protein GcvH [Kingella sp. (in: b-proteobacteria)]STR11165.1 Glycine cleavage system H protein [Kingella denitrificans]